MIDYLSRLVQNLSPNQIGVGERIDVPGYEEYARVQKNPWKKRPQLWEARASSQLRRKAVMFLLGKIDNLRDFIEET